MKKLDRILGIRIVSNPDQVPTTRVRRGNNKDFFLNRFFEKIIIIILLVNLLIRTDCFLIDGTTYD